MNTYDLTNQSADLSLFYNSYARWLDKGAPIDSDNVFTRHNGLCFNLSLHCSAMYDVYSNMHEILATELEISLITELQDENFPFNDIHGSYIDEARTERCHLNKARIDWVKSHCKPLVPHFEEEEIFA